MKTSAAIPATIDDVVVENWKEAPVVFHKHDAFVNLTTMCRPFNKTPALFLRLESAKAFIAALEANCAESAQFADDKAGNGSFFTVEGRNGGTWAHPDLALECARWLSPEFAIWTNRVIRQLLTTGLSKEVTVHRPLLTCGEEDELSYVMGCLVSNMSDAHRGRIPPTAAQAVNSAACQYMRGLEMRIQSRMQ